MGDKQQLNGGPTKMASLAQLNTEALLNGCSCKSKDFAFQSAHPQLCLVFGGFSVKVGKGI